MQFINFNSIYSVFGNFAVFDEDNVTIINKIFEKCNIAINQEPQNKANKSGKVMIINDPLTHYVYTLRPNRLDIQVPSFPKEKVNEVINNVSEKYKAFANMFENSYGTRIAVITSDFCFDDNGEYSKMLAESSFDYASITELHLRATSRMDYEDETYNIVTNIDNCGIAVNNSPNKRRSIMINQDLNSILENNSERFDLSSLDSYFSFLYKLSRERLEFYIQKN